MSDENRPGEHSFGGSQPRWPSGEEPRWPSGNETPWERPPHGVSRYRNPWEQNPSGHYFQDSYQESGQPQWPSGHEHEQDREAPPPADWPPLAGGEGGQWPPPPGPSGDYDDATEMLPEIDRAAYEPYAGGEPELLTHGSDEEESRQETDPEAEQRINALVASSAVAGAGAGAGAGAATDGTGAGGGGAAAAHHAESGHNSGSGQKDTKQKPRTGRVLRRTLYAFIGLFVVLPIVAFGIAYLVVDVPDPNEVAADQGTVLPYFYADGTEMGRDAEQGNRVMLSASEIPEEVRHAAYAAEDATFESNRGFDVTAIMRAGWSQLTGGTGGGSTISQQYIKVATESDERTLQRKATEVVRAFKMNNQQSKSEIITSYLNTIYLGRGSYGVQAASQAYFDKDVEQLNKSEAAYLAGIIQAPSRSDDQQYTERRWNYVADQMVANGWMSESERAEAEFPTPIDPDQAQPTTMSGPKHYIKERVKQELEEVGFPESQVRAQGLQVHTTIDQEAQELAIETVQDVMEGQPDNLHDALVAVDPNTGGTLAYYGGELSEDNQRDWADTPRNPGSTMKPFDFVALLQMGRGAGEVYDGTSPRTFGEGSDPVTVNNVEGADCPNCTVAEGMERSVNTVFYDMVFNDTGPAAVAEAAESAGVSERSTLDGESTNIAIGGGSTTITPHDMAAAFSTFAADGIQRDSHLISKLTTAEGDIVYQASPEGEPAFDNSEDESEQIAGNVTETLQDVLPHSNLSCADGRTCAGKTGTHQSHEDGENSQAWMLGYTPSLSTAVWVGDAGSDPIRNASGAQVYGSGLPGQIWKQFTDAYLEGTPDEPFTDVEQIGEPSPTPSPEPVIPEPEDDAPPARETEEPEQNFETPEETEDTDNGQDDGNGGNGNNGDDNGETQTNEPTEEPTETDNGDDNGDDNDDIFDQ